MEYILGRVDCDKLYECKNGEKCTLVEGDSFTPNIKMDDYGEILCLDFFSNWQESK